MGNGECLDELERAERVQKERDEFGDGRGVDLRNLWSDQLKKEGFIN